MTPLSIAAAMRTFNGAAEAVRNATKATYPVGTRIEVTLGNARISAVVTGHRTWGTYQPDAVMIRNEVSGKSRKFEAAQDRHNVVVTQLPR